MSLVQAACKGGLDLHFHPVRFIRRHQVGKSITVQHDFKMGDLYVSTGRHSSVRRFYNEFEQKDNAFIVKRSAEDAAMQR